MLREPPPEHKLIYLASLLGINHVLNIYHSLSESHLARDDHTAKDQICLIYPLLTIFIRVVDKVGVSAQMCDVCPVDCSWLIYPSYICYWNSPRGGVTKGEEWPITITPGGIIEAL